MNKIKGVTTIWFNNATFHPPQPPEFKGGAREKMCQAQTQLVSPQFKTQKYYSCFWILNCELKTGC
jgi:hypothetical protein